MEMHIGFDMSHWQTDSVFKEGAEKSGVLILKATQGTSYVDRTYSTRQNYLNRIGVRSGAYHFYERKKDVEKQAVFFCRTVEPYVEILKNFWMEKGVRHIPWIAVLDVEGFTITKDDVNHIIQWLNICERELNIRPVIYCSWHDYKNIKYLGGNNEKYWVARWTKNSNLLDEVLLNENVIGIQYTSSYPIQNHRVDADRFKDPFGSDF